MTKFKVKHEFLDSNGNVRIILDGKPASVLVQDDTGNIRTSLRPGSVIIGPKPSGQTGGPLGNVGPFPDDQVVVNPNLPPPLPTVALTIGGVGTRGRLVLLDSTGKPTFSFDSIGANLRLFNQSGQVSIRLDGRAGDVELLGADCAEEFEVDATESLEPGMVMVIDEGEQLRPCVNAYDRKVAGVLSGAGNYRPGIVLGKRISSCRRTPIALVGRAYCKVDASYAPIEMGDLLTTSNTIGHAMKACDPSRAFGAVIGKSLSPLKEGTGLLPVLIALQ